MNNDMFLKILKLFGNKGCKFTTEDLARDLGTSKRTIYSSFSNKSDIIEKTIDFFFLEIINSDSAIIEDEKLSIKEKIKLCFQATPDVYNIGNILRHRDDLQKYYPNLNAKVDMYMNVIWDKLMELVEQGIENKILKDVDTVILKLMFNETLKKLLDFEFTAQNQISFNSGLKTMYDIALYGLIAE